MKETENQANASNDFDFLVGSWRVYHRRLKERLAGNDDWIEFEGTCVMQKILGGAGNIDENFLDLPGGSYHAVTLRTYNAEKKQWSIWWFDGRSPGHLDPPVVANSKMASEGFTPTILLKANRFVSAFCGRISLPSRVGNRPSPKTGAKRGTRIGSWNS